jgi:cytochrome P450
MSFYVQPDWLGPLPDFLDRTPTAPLTSVELPSGDYMWLVTDYRIARTVLTDARFSRAAAALPGAPKWGSVDPSPSSIVSLEGTAHSRLRRVVAPAFTTGRLARQIPTVERMVGELVTAMDDCRRSADLVAEFTSVLPMAGLATLLGVPSEYRQIVGDAVTALFDITPSAAQRRTSRVGTLLRYVSDLLARKRVLLEEDLLSALVVANDSGVLSDSELTNLVVSLLMAGYQTTADQLSTAVLTLLLDDSLPRTALDEAFVNEVMRRTPATPLSFPRVAVEDVELGGVKVAAGDGLLVSLLHGNHDRRQFTEPDQFRVGRRLTHLAFGHGVHRCLGAPFASLQIKIALTGLFERFPLMRLADSENAVDWNRGLATCGLSRLEVTW